MSVPSPFDPGSISAFRIVGREFDPASRTVVLRYALDDAIAFTETITFETVPSEEVQPGPGFERALLHLHIAAGTSYYKTAAPGTVVIEGDTLTESERAFHHLLYDDGLREFAVTNGLPVPRPVILRSEERSPTSPPPAPGRRGGVLVPVGGGKDSMVVVEALRDRRPLLFAVNPHPLVRELADQSGLDLLTVRRRLDPELAALNRQGALNGHVPITAILSLVSVVGSFLYGYDTIAMAIEHSASEETRIVGGAPVNHQYSKSAVFEQRLVELVRTTIDPSLVYGSVLRPYSELAIARAFAGLTRFHSTFCSCNSVFRQSAGVDDGWCGHCPKCRFVGLMLAPFVDRSALTSIIGRDMFDDPAQTDGFAALMSDSDKPFECVGERRESATALRILADDPQWRDSPVVRALADRARALVGDESVTELLTPRCELAFPDPEIAAAVDRLLSGTG
jgi:UDP-N-acetyl-alpha-D-muramoyl-L-alanyl-L-glutamate epimerase